MEAYDGPAVAASLEAWLEPVTFGDLDADGVTAHLVDAVVAWGGDRGWRVYRRAPSVVTLPPPMQRLHSVVDVACARPDGPPVVVEVDGTDRRRTLDKLVAEAAAGRVPVWVRWGAGRFAAAPPPPVNVVRFPVVRTAPGRFARGTAPERPPPRHSVYGVEAAPVELPFE
jgi:hypothetical protein